MNWLAVVYLILGIKITGILASDSYVNAYEHQNASYRLDETIKPSHYEIEIKPYLLASSQPQKQFTFDGTAKITLRTNRIYVRNIVLHAKHLTIYKTEIELISHSLRPTQYISMQVSVLDGLTDKISVNLNQSLESNKDYILKFKYTGKMEDNELNGFYRSEYMNHNSEKIWIASTYLQPNHARKLFPCFDEPKFKAKFVIKINRENAYSSLSNMKLSHSIPVQSEHRTIDVYKETPVMSTYLVAILISQYKPRENRNLTIWSKPEVYDKTKFASEFTPKVIKYFDEYTGIPYRSMDRMEKLDMAGIYRFPTAGMENWGLILFTEDLLLYNPYEHGLLWKEKVAMVISHEIAHMWFGNLVTCEWWSYTWLNEGFAKYFGYLAVNEIMSTSDIENRFVTEDLHLALEIDSNPDTFPLTDRTVEKSSDLNKMFGQIPYSKGGSIVRMISHMMGEDKFRRAVKKYLDQNKYKTAMPETLFSVLLEFWTSQNVDLKQLLLDWTEQPGYPVIRVELKNNGQKIEVSQERYKTPGTERWNIPLSYTTSRSKDFTSTTPRAYIRKGIQTEHFQLDTQVDWIIANIQQTGFYRVNYDKKTWENIGKALKADNFSGIHEINRAQIIDDIANFAAIGLVEQKLPFKILDFIKNDYSYMSWYSIAKFLNSILGKIDDTHENSLKKYILHLTENAYNKFKFHQSPGAENISDIYTRNTVRKLACLAGNTDCISHAVTTFDECIADPKKSMSPEISAVVYCTSVREFGQKYSDHLKNMYKYQNDHEKKIKYLIGQSCTKDQTEFNKFLDFVIMDVPQTDRAFAFQSIYKENIDLAFDYIVNNYERLLNFLEDKSELVYILQGYAPYLSTEEQLQDYKKISIINKNIFDDEDKKILNAGIQRVQENIDWNKKHSSLFEEYMNDSSDAGKIGIIIKLFLFTYVILHIFSY